MTQIYTVLKNKETCMCPMCVTSVVQLQGPDPFADVEAEMGLAGLISGVMATSEQCSSVVYVSGDNELATSVEFGDDTWDQRFLESLGVQNDMENQDSDTEETDILPSPPKVNITMKLCKH